MEKKTKRVEGVTSSRAQVSVKKRKSALRSADAEAHIAIAESLAPKKVRKKSVTVKKSVSSPEKLAAKKRVSHKDPNA